MLQAKVVAELDSVIEQAEQWGEFVFGIRAESATRFPKTTF